MALPAKKVSLSVVVVVILLFSVHAHARRLSPTWDDKEYQDYWKTRINQERPRDDSEYLTYSVLLRERPNGGGEAMDNSDKDALRRWYESFVPSTPTDSGEPRLVDCYSFDVNGFLATLTGAEAMALAKKPGVVRHMTSSYLEPFVYDPASCGFVTAITKRSSVRSRPAF